MGENKNATLEYIGNISNEYFNYVKTNEWLWYIPWIIVGLIFAIKIIVGAMRGLYASIYFTILTIISVVLTIILSAILKDVIIEQITKISKKINMEDIVELTKTYYIVIIPFMGLTIDGLVQAIGYFIYLIVLKKLLRRRFILNKQNNGTTKKYITFPFRIGGALVAGVTAVVPATLMANVALVANGGYDTKTNNLVQKSLNFIYLKENKAANLGSFLSVVDKAYKASQDKGILNGDLNKLIDFNKLTNPNEPGNQSGTPLFENGVITKEALDKIKPTETQKESVKKLVDLVNTTVSDESPFDSSTAIINIIEKQIDIKSAIANNINKEFIDKIEEQSEIIETAKTNVSLIANKTGLVFNKLSEETKNKVVDALTDKIEVANVSKEDIKKKVSPIIAQFVDTLFSKDRTPK